MKVIKKLISFSFIALLGLLLFACAPPEEPNQGNEGSTTEGSSNSNGNTQSKTLNVANTATVTTWDPSISFSTEVAYLSNIYEPLIWAAHPDDDEYFIPALAEDWEHNEDGTIWTFKIREGVTFHDGAKLDAEAVKKSIERTREIGLGASFIWDPVTEINVTDEYTVEFVLSDSVPFERIASSANGAWIMSPEVLDKDEDWFNLGNEAGTGPWKLESYEPDQELVLSKNEDYWGDWNTNYEEVRITIISEALVQQQMLEAGEIDIATSVPVENVKSLEENPDIQVIRSESFSNYLGFFNTTKPPLDNPKVRQALSHAIPYDDIIEVATKGAGTQPKGPVPKGLWPYDDSLPQYELNLDKARELFEEANVNPDGLKLSLTYAAENPTHERYAPLIKESFAELGIDLEIRPVQWNTQWDEAKQDPENAQDIFLLLWWPSYSDGYDNLSSMFTTEETPSWNLAYWYNEQYDKTLKEAYLSSGVDKEKSQELYIEAQKMLIDEAVAAYILDTQTVIPMSSSLDGQGVNPNYPFVIFYHKLHTN